MSDPQINCKTSDMSGSCEIIVSVVIPSYEEERFIENCLDSIINSDFPSQFLEILVVDGRSKDRTRAIVAACAVKHPRIRLLDNPKIIAPAAMNIGTQAARGEYILQMDAHADLDRNYISQCVDFLAKNPEASAVAGAMKTLPMEQTPTGKMIASAISIRFGVGGSTFRTGSGSAVWVSTAYCCCYRKNVFRDIGLYNESLPRGFDFDLNQRLVKSGRKILLIPDFFCRYFARSRLNWKFVKYYFWEGFWAIYPFKIVGKRFLTISHLVPAIFVLSLGGTGLLSFNFDWLRTGFIVIAGSYTIGLAVATFSIWQRLKHWACFALLPLIYITIHVMYGLGSVFAFLKPRSEIHER